MNSALNISLSGFNAAALNIQAAANNIANQNSTQTQSADGTVTNAPPPVQQVQQSALPNGGVEAKIVPSQGAPQDIFQPSSPAANQQGIVQVPDVDAGQQLVEAQISSYNAQGNLTALKTEEKNQQALLDIIT